MTFQTTTTPFQNSIKALEMKQGEKYTIFYISDWGMVTTLKIKLDHVRYESYAQYTDAIQIVGTPFKKRSAYGFWFYNSKNLVIYEGWVDYEENVLWNTRTENGVTTKLGKFSSCDNQALVEIVKSLKQEPIYTLIHDYHKEYQITNSQAINEIKEFAEKNNGTVHECVLNKYGLTPRHVKETFDGKYQVELY